MERFLKLDKQTQIDIIKFNEMLFKKKWSPTLLCNEKEYSNSRIIYKEEVMKLKKWIK